MLPICTNQIVFRSCFFLRHEPTSGRRHPQPGTKKFPCLPDDKRERERKCPGTTATFELASFALPPPTSQPTAMEWLTALRASPISTLIVVGVAMFTDALIYGMVVPIFVPEVLGVSSLQVHQPFAFAPTTNHHHSGGAFLLIALHTARTAGHSVCCRPGRSVAVHARLRHPLGQVRYGHACASQWCNPSFSFSRTGWLTKHQHRFGRKWPMLAGFVGLSGATLMLAFITYSTCPSSSSTTTTSTNSHFDVPSSMGTRYYPAMVMARFLQGASAAATWVAGLALLADTYPSHELGSAMGLVMTAMSMGMLLGPPFGGFVYQWGGYQLPFIIASGISIYERAWSGRRALS